MEQHNFNNGITQQQRDELVMKFMPLANKIACQKHKDLPKCVQLDEVKSAAYYGLLDACGKYEEAKKDRFPLYARIRIIGEINDYLRRCTWGGRNRPIYGWSLDVPVYGSRGRRPLPLEEGLTCLPESSSVESEEFFEELTRCLPSKVRKIMRLYYMDNLTMKAISDKLGICESRVSQIVACYKQVIQRIWAGREDELWSVVRNGFRKDKFRLGNNGQRGDARDRRAA